MRKLAPALAMTLAFTLAGCGGGPPDGTPDGLAGETPRAASATPSKPSAARLRTLPATLRFEGTTLDGERFTGANLAERPVVFWFWAAGCSACESEGSVVASMAEKYGSRVAFVGIAGRDESRDRTRRFVDRTGTGGITQLDDRSGTLNEHFKVTARPSFLFTRRDGSAERASGPLGQDDLERHVRPLAGG